MRGVVRRKASAAAALVFLACGALAGGALADGPSLGSVTTPAVTTPAVTAPAVTTPSVTTPAVTTPAVTTPAVTAPAVTTPSVTTPAVTTPVVTTPAVSPPTASVTATVSDPGKPAANATVVVGPQPAVSVSAPVASASVTAPAVTEAPTAVVDAAGSQQNGVSATIGSSGSLQTRAGVTAAPTSATSNGAVGAPAELAAPTSPLIVAGWHGQTTAASGSVATPRIEATTHLLAPSPRAVGWVKDLSPLALLSGTTSPAAALATAAVFEPRSSAPSSGATWSAVTRHRVALGGAVAALLALAGLGLAGAARSATFAAACADLARLPFPRFRVLPCSGVGTAAAGPAAGSGSNGGGSGGSNGSGSGPTTAHAAGIPGGPLPSIPPLPRLHVIGAALTKAPWSIVRWLVLSVLALVNLLVLGIRWHVGRLQAR